MNTKRFMNWVSGSGSPNQLEIDGKLVSKASSIAAAMNNYFIEKVAAVRRDILCIPNTYSECHQMMRGKFCKLWLDFVTPQKVFKLLRSLKKSKSCGIDGLDSFSLKVAAEHIYGPLHHVLTLSLMQQKFPSSWRYSKIIPLHKKDSRLDKRNYRPVAILSPISKILEKVVFQQIYEYFTRNKIFDDNLHGYRKNRSIQTALLTIYDRWVRAAAKGHINGVVLIDLSSAFDLVDHDILQMKLRIYGLQDDFLSWVNSYLRERFQAVWIDHTMSNFIKCDVGVPQGSILGPLLFLIYFNDLPRSIPSHVDSYADDTTISCSGFDIQEVEEKLTADCNSIETWMKTNKLKLNVKKTHVLTIGTQNRLMKIGKKVDVKLEDVRLEESPSGAEVLLGCKVQTNLKWNKHIEMIMAKLSSRLCGLAYLRHICPFKIKKTVTECMFTSIVIYCLPLIGGMGAGLLREVQTLQNKAARLVCNAPSTAHRKEMYDKLNWMTINQLIAYHSLLAVYKLRQQKEPGYLANWVCNDSRNGRIMIPTTNLTVTNESFCFRGPTMWNILPILEALRRTWQLGFFRRSKDS